MTDRAEQTSRTEYAVIVTDGSGQAHNLGTWSAVPNVRVTVDGDNVVEDVVALRVVRRRVIITPQRWETLPTLAADETESEAG